jgi:DNA-binding IclR family transcriptional regulator
MTTQALERALRLIRILAAAGAEGCRLTDLQHQSALTKPTVHRILDTLRREGVVEQIEESRRYRLGQELAALGWSANRTVYDLKDLASEDMTAIAGKTGDTSFLSVRSGSEAVCIDRQTGSYPVKAFTVDVGTRRPLGIGATGVAILAALDVDEERAAITAISEQLGRFPNATLRTIKESVAKARVEGFALSDGLMLKGVRGVAVVIRDSGQRPIAAIGVAAIGERIAGKRVDELVRLLKRHANHIEQRIAATESRLHSSSVQQFRSSAAKTRRTKNKTA